MVDFRYHLISLIAVILALALGILAGSGFLGGPILDQLKGEVTGFKDRTRELNTLIDEQDASLNQAEDFAQGAEPLLIHGQLAGAEIVLFQFEGAEGRLVDGIKNELSEAGAQVISEITLTSKLALGSAPAQDELSLITGSLTGDPDQLLEDLAVTLGERAAAAAADSGQTEAPTTTASQRFDALVGQLETSEFVGVDATQTDRVVPPGAEFIVIGGSPDRPPFAMDQFMPALMTALGERGAPSIVVEETASTWGLVRAVRTNIEARSRASTVDNGETTIGRIAVILGLDQAGEGNIGHFGVQAGRTAIIPAPNPTG
ncbi:MAG: hypothetical protein QOG04_1408 [Actinomycetota bacterium]|jgi:hypothetical protein|nr:hypothetical protein [Actinomycetota bacterium]